MQKADLRAVAGGPFMPMQLHTAAHRHVPPAASKARCLMSICTAPLSPKGKASCCLTFQYHVVASYVTHQRAAATAAQEEGSRKEGLSTSLLRRPTTPASASAAAAAVPSVPAVSAGGACTGPADESSRGRLGPCCCCCCCCSPPPPMCCPLPPAAAQSSK